MHKWHIFAVRSAADVGSGGTVIKITSYEIEVSSQSGTYPPSSSEPARRHSQRVQVGCAVMEANDSFLRRPVAD